MSLKVLLKNISYHKEQIKSSKETLLGLLHQIQDNDYFSDYINSLKNVIYNLNYLNISENIYLENINRRIDFHHRDIEIYSGLRKLKTYKCCDPNIVLSKLLYRNVNKLYNWFYELHFLTSNQDIKTFIEITNIGLPLEINKIISSFLPNYKTVDLRFNLRLDKTTLNNYEHKKKFFWKLVKIDSNIHNSKNFKLKTYKNLIDIELIKYSYYTYYLENNQNQNKELKLLDFINNNTKKYFYN